VLKIRVINSFKEDKIPIFAHLKSNGPLAEWLGTALQKLLQRFESARDLRKGDINAISPFSIFTYPYCYILVFGRL
jgi:hypothetical protein